MFIAVVIPIGLLSTVSVLATDQSDYNPPSSEASFQTKILTNGLENSSEHMKNVKNDVYKHEANKSELHGKDEAMSGTTTPPNVNLTTIAPNKYRSLLNRRKALIGEYLKEYQNIYKANRNTRSSTSKEHKRSYENDFTAPHFSYDYVDDNTFEERQRRRNLKNDDVRSSETEVKISYGNSDIDLSKEKNRSANNNKCDPSSRGNCSYTPGTSYSSETANGKHCRNNKCNTFPDINIHRKTQKCGPLGECSNEAQNGKQKHFDSNDRFPQKGKNDVKEDSENQMQEILNGKLANKIVDNVILRMHSNKELRFHFGSEVAKYDYGYSPDHWTGLSGSSFVLQETNYRSRIDIAMTKIKNILGHLVDQEVQRKSCNILQPDLKKFLLWLLEVQNHAKKKTYFNKENFLFHYQDFTGTNNEQANEFDKQLKLPPFYRHIHQNESRDDTLTVRNFLNISVTPSSHPQLHDIANTQQISLKNKSENPSVLSEDASGTLQTDEVQAKLPRSKENILPATNNTIQNGPEQQLIKKMLSSLGLVPSSRKRRLT